MNRQYELRPHGGPTFSSIFQQIDPYTAWNTGPGSAFDPIGQVASAIIRRSGGDFRDAANPFPYIVTFDDFAAPLLNNSEKRGPTDPNLQFENVFLRTLQAPLQPSADFNPFDFLAADQDFLPQSLGGVDAINRRGDAGSAHSFSSAGPVVTSFRLPLPARAGPRPSSARDGIIRVPSDPKSVLGALVEAYKPDPDLDPDKMVITGTVDTAANLGHVDFRSVAGPGQAAGTRIEFAHIQDGTFDPRSNVAFGREIMRSEIDRAIRDYGEDTRSLLTELEIVKPDYQEFDSASRMLSHGQHVLSMAAGYAPHEVASAQEASDINHHRIIHVQLPDLAVADTSGSNLYVLARYGLDYILIRALAMSVKHKTPIPVVLNFSFGLGAGPHNGAHPIEREARARVAAYVQSMVDRLNAVHEADGNADLTITADDVQVDYVAPAGNRRLAQGHAFATQDQASGGTAPLTLTLPLRLQPDDRTSNFVEFWIPEAAKFTEIEIRTPLQGRPLKWTLADGEMTCDLVEVSGANALTIGRLTIDQPHDNRFEGSYHRLHIALAPTTDWVLGSEHLAPAGIWEVSVTASDLSDDDRIHAWVQRDDIALGYANGARPAYLDDEIYENERLLPDGEVRRFDPPNTQSVVRRDGSISSIATKPVGVGPGFHFIGGTYQHYEKKRDPSDHAPYSGLGYKPSTGWGITGPDAYEPSERSRVFPGMRASGMTNGSNFALGGTSVAAPQYAMELVRQIQQARLNAP